jgi:hypothetical protein
MRLRRERSRLPNRSSFVPAHTFNGSRHRATAFFRHRSLHRSVTLSQLLNFYAP